MKEQKMIGRVRYVENWNNEGEHFVFEWKFENESDKEWRFECAASLFDVQDGKLKRGSGEMIHYTALAKIREWMKLGIRDILWQ